MKRLIIPLAVLSSLCLAMHRLLCMCMCRGKKLCFAHLVKLDKEQREMYNALSREKADISDWEKRTACELKRLTAEDGTRLFARIYPVTASGKWAVVVHGYGGEGTLMLYAAKRFYERGYNILLPDLRSHGKSEGKYIGWGLNDSLDILDWCDFITKKNPNARIALYGVSMGGAAVLMSAGENKVSNIKCVVSDCAYTSLNDVLRYRIRRMLHLPPCLVMCVLVPFCRLYAGLKIGDVSVTNAVKKCKVPIMLCHGDRDRFVPTDNVLELYAIAKPPKKLVLTHGAGHGVSAFVGGERYWSRVFEFTEKWV
jgi:hypothetical protein